MSNTSTTRVDEVSQYYAPAKKLGTISVVLFWLNAVLSFVMPYSASTIGEEWSRVLQAIFLVLVLIYFSISQISSLYLVPRAELMRRKQLLSDSFGIPLSQDYTSLYYNNSYSPSVQRLGANTMENALFSKEIALRMLVRKRFVIFGYLFAWLLAFSLRHNNLELLTWITQLVFSRKSRNCFCPSLPNPANKSSRFSTSRSNVRSPIKPLSNVAPSESAASTGIS